MFSSSDSLTKEAQDLHFVRALECICDMMGCATSQASLLKGTSHCGEAAQTELLTDLSISPALHRIEKEPWSPKPRNYHMEGNVAPCLHLLWSPFEDAP